VATDSVYLDAIWAALAKIQSFDESRPLEILVRVAYDASAGDGVYTHESVSVVPLCVVYGRQWVCDLAEGQRWEDQMPWDVNLCARRDEPPRAVSDGGDKPGVPRLEIEADLRELDEETRTQVRELLGDPAAAAAAPQEVREAMLSRLNQEDDRFRVNLVDLAPFAVNERHRELPDKRSDIRVVRRQFLLNLALRRMMGGTLHIDDDMVRHAFPRYRGGSSRKSLASQFVGAVPGQRHKGLGPLFGEPKEEKGYAQFIHDKKTSSYRLGLDRCLLVLRLRL
jgi:hypothetical protein